MSPHVYKPSFVDKCHCEPLCTWLPRISVVVCLDRRHRAFYSEEEVTPEKQKRSPSPLLPSCHSPLPFPVRFYYTFLWVRNTGCPRTAQHHGTLVLQSVTEAMPLVLPMKSGGIEMWSPPSPVVVSARAPLTPLGSSLGSLGPPGGGGPLGSKSPPLNASLATSAPTLASLGPDFASVWRQSSNGTLNGYSSWSDMVIMDSQETEELLLLGGMSGRCASLQTIGYGTSRWSLKFVFSWMRKTGDVCAVLPWAP